MHSPIDMDLALPRKREVDVVFLNVCGSWEITHEATDS